MLEVENSSPKDLKSFTGIPDRQIFSCPYTDMPDDDYFSLMVLNEAGEIMIVEDLTANSAWGSWHLVNGKLKNGENSVTAVKHRLLETTGYISNNWLYLGSYMLNAGCPDMAGHFFTARDVEQIAAPHFSSQHTCAIRWVSSQELKYALLDGRIGMMSYAVAVSLALLLTPAQSRFPTAE